MKKQLLINLLILAFSFSGQAQKLQQKIGANPTVISPSAALEVESTTKGFLPPRMDTTQRNAISSPATGLTIFNATNNRLETNIGTPAAPTWASPVSATGGIYGGSGPLVGNTIVTGAANTLAFTSTATNGFSVDGTTLSVDAANNRVGIGTATPTRTLDVTGGDAVINGMRVGRGEGNNFQNTVVGDSALNANTSGNWMTAIGRGALSASTTGNQDTAVGNYALNANTTGSLNTALGTYAMALNTTGSRNTAIGNLALRVGTTNDGCVAIGNTAGMNINSAAGTGYNIVIGVRSGFDLTTGTNNIFLGGANNSNGATYAGTGIITGSNNVVIGSNVTGLAADTANNIVIADGEGNRRINVDGTGRVGIGTTTPVATLTVNGGVSGTSAYQNLSDKRYKKDVQPIKNALDKVLALNGVTFNWDKIRTDMNLDDKNHIGVLAQDIEKVLPQVVITADDANKTKSVAYGDIVPVLIEAIKEQQAEIEALKKMVKQLMNK